MIKFSEDENNRIEELMSGTMEICMDAEHISITVDRYEKLLKAEAELNVIRSGFALNHGYQVEYVLEAVFGRKLEPTASNPEAGGPDA